MLALSRSLLCSSVATCCRQASSFRGREVLQTDIDAINAEIEGFFGFGGDSVGASGSAGGEAHDRSATTVGSDRGFDLSSLHGVLPWDKGAAVSHASTSSTGSAGSTGADGPRLTHVDMAGRASMVDVSMKHTTVRSATASARVLLSSDAFTLVASNQLKKGDVLTVAKLAGIMGAKHTSTLIPLCHNIPISKVDVSLALDTPSLGIAIQGTVTTAGQTGVEMEALTAVCVAALTVYDMVKAVAKDAVITDVRLERKSGGKSGDYMRQG